MLDLEEELKIFISSAPSSKYVIKTIQIAHSQISKTYNFWSEPYVGQVTTEADVVLTMEPLNFEVELAGSDNNLDRVYNIKIDLVDSTDTLVEEIDRIPLNTTEKIQLVFREYMSDNLEEPQSMITLQVESLSYQKGVANLSAISPRFNVLRTGEIYTPKDVPMLRGFL